MVYKKGKYILKLSIVVKPNSTKGPLIIPQPDGSLIIYAREIASDGQANEAVIRLISKHFKIPKNKVRIIRGQTSKHKLIEMDIQ